MSQTIYSLSTIATILSSILFFGLMIFFVLELVIAKISSYYRNKKESFEEEKKREFEEYSAKKLELNHELVTESQDVAEELKALNEKHNKDCSEIANNIRKYSDKEQDIDSNWSAIKWILAIIAVFILIMSVSIDMNTRGDFSSLEMIQNDNTGVQATAYYVIDYDYVEQSTITVFVKNNTDQILNQAIVREVNTGKTALIESIEPGQEKIVSIEVYPEMDSDYKFEITDTQFK